MALDQTVDVPLSVVGSRIQIDHWLVHGNSVVPLLAIVGHLIGLSRYIDRHSFVGYGRLC